MAKVVGLIGSASGKVGNVVYAVRNGIQTARVYQPVVSNPKSSGQLLQRAKMNLIGQLSSIMPKEVLIGLGKSTPARRSRFLKLNMLNTTASVMEDSRIRAKLANDDLVLSEGAVVPVVWTSSVSATANAVVINANILSGHTAEEIAASGSIIVAVVQDTSGVWEYVNYRFVQASEITGEYLQISFPHNAGEGGYYVDVYSVPFKTADGGKLTTIAESLFGSESDFNAEMSVNPAALPLSWGRNYLTQSGTYTPA